MTIGTWIRRVTHLLRRSAWDDDLRREMEAHRAEMGDPRAFGNTLRLRDEARDAWGWRWLDDLMQDSRFAVRMLRHSPGFVLTAVVTLALGIGVNAGMFSVVDALLLRPLYQRADDVVDVHAAGKGARGGFRGVSYPNYLDIREGTSDVFSELTATSTMFVGVDAGDGARRAMAMRVSAGYFEMFGVPLTIGRPFTTGESGPGAGIPVAVISHALWQRQGGDAGILGRTVRVNGDPFTIVGVAAEGFTGTGIPGPEVWVPLGAQRGRARRLSERDAHELEVAGRLRPGMTIEAATPALATVASRLERAFPEVNAGFTLKVSPPSRLLFMPGAGSGIMATLTLLLMAMPAIVLLVACLNLADLLLARGHVRQQELAVRSWLGSGRGRLIRQLLTEGLLLALVGGAIGLVASTWATSALIASLRPMLPVIVNLPDVGLDSRVVAGTIGFSVAASLLFGAWPAWKLTGRAAVGQSRRVADEGIRPRGIRIATTLVVGQVALSLLLLACGGLFLMSAIGAAAADPGFDLERGVLAEIDPGLAGYDDERARELHLTLVDRLRTLPGVETVTIASQFPFSGFHDSRNVLAADGAGSATPVDALFTVIGRDHARTLGIPLLAGRDFLDAELRPGSGEPVAIIDDGLAQRLWPGQAALDRLIRFGNDEGAPSGPAIRVAGVVGSVNHSMGNPNPFPHVYIPIGQEDVTAMTVQLRVSREEAERSTLNAIAGVVRDLDARVPILRLETWRDYLDTGLMAWVYRSGARIFSAFGGIALLLAVIGVYGVKSYVVSRRTREFGIRIASGAEPRVLLWQVLLEGGRTTGIGIVIGLVLAAGAGQILQGILYGVNSIEPIVMLTAPVILLAASLVASYIPARRATRVDPTVALRSE